MHFLDRPISVHITTREGDKLKEYKQEVKGDDTTCYIESRPGEEWRIRLGWETAQDQRGEYDYEGEIYVDGKQLEDTFLRLSEEESFLEGVRSEDEKSIRPFVFQTLTVGDSDDEEVQHLDEATVRGLGSIVIELSIGTFSEPCAWYGLVDPTIKPSIQPLMVHEKMKKKTSEVTMLGDACETILPSTLFWFTHSVPPRSFKFTFLYRSAALLELEDIQVEGHEDPIVPDEPVVPEEPIVPDEPIAPVPPVVRAVWDPIAAEAEFNRLQDEIEAAEALAPGLPDIKGKRKRNGAGAEAAGKKIKLESGTIVISDDDDDDDEVVEIKKEIKKENIYRVKQEKGARP